MNDKLKDLSTKIKASRKGGGEQRIEAQHKKGSSPQEKELKCFLMKTVLRKSED